MKKFFSLLCATLLVFSASAAPVAKKAEIAKKAPVAVEQMQKVQFEEAQSVKTLSLENVQLSNLNRLSAAPALTVSNQKATAPAVKANSQKVAKASKQMVRRVATSAKTVAKAPQNTAITIGDFSASTYEGEYYVILTDAASSAQFIFDIDISANPFELGKTYTIADMIDGYTGIGDAEDWYAWTIVTDASYTETKDQDGLTHVVASMTDEDGNVYDITYDQPEPQSKTIVASDFSMEDYGTDMFFILTDSVGNQFRFDVLYTGSFEFDKTYTLADMDPDYSWYKLATGGGLTYIEASFTITEDQDELLHVVAAAVLSNGDSYEITYDEKAFEPTGKQIEVNGTDLNGQYLSAYGFYLYTATWGDYTVQLAFDAEEEKASYTNEDFIADYGLIYTNSEKIPLLKLASDNITITNTETTKTLAGSVYAKNGDEYVLNLVYEKPTVETATAIVEDAKLTKTSQFFHVDGNDTKGEYGITLYVVTKNLEGEFTVEDLDVYSSGVTDLSVKKWFDIDSCNIVSEKLGSNTLVISGLLHTSNEQLGRFIDLTFIMTARVDANGELMDIYGIITQPANGTTKEYNRLATNTCFYNNSGTKLGYQSGTATLVECADGTVYWQNPVSRYTSGAWIKGKKEGSTITFATKQPVSYSSQYNITLSVRWGNFNTQKFAVADDYADSFILDIKGDSLIMRGTQATTGSTATYFPGIFWDDDDSFQGYGDCGVNLYIPGWTPSTELITPPAGLVTAKMPFTGSGAQTEYADSVLVGWDNDTVYIQGLAVDFPTAWIKGVLKEGVVTFEKFQYVGKYGTMPIWVLGTNAESELLDFTMTYDAQANLFKATNIFVVNASYEKIYYLDKVSKIVIGEVAQADWGEWEDFAPFGFNTGSWTFVAMASSPQTYTNYVALVRTDKNNADNKQIKITNWGEGWFGEGVELIINWNAKDNTCSIDKQYTGYTNTQYGKVYVASVEDGTYNPETGTFSIHVDYTVSAGSFGNDVETYVMDAKQPGMMYDTDAPFDATFAWSDMSTDLDEGVISIYATNAEGYTIGLELYADPAATEIPAGVYTISDTQEAGTALQSLGVAGGYLTECWAGTRAASGGIDDCWFMVKGTITLSYDEYGKLKVVVDAKNSYEQPVTALVQYVKLEPKSTVDIVSTDLSYTDEWYAQYGIQEFVLTNDNYGVLLDIFADTLVGEFTEDDVDLADSYIVDFNTGAEIPVVNTGDIVVTLDGKNLTLTATLIGADTVQYNISATGYLGYIQGDAVEGYVGEFAVEEVAIQQVTLSKVKYIYIQGTNAAGDQLALVVKGELEDDAIAAGTYNEVMACTGFDAEGQINPSYVGNNTGVWFIQSGELVVNENGAMAFAGVNSYDAPVAIGFTVPVGPATDYYLVGWINGAAYGIEGDIDNFGDYHFVDGKVKATFNELSYVQVKDNNKQIYGTDSYIAPAESGNATLVANGPEKIAINGGVEYEYTLTVNEDGTLTLSYETITTGLRNAKANVKAAKQIKKGQIVIVRENKEYNILGTAL